MEKAYIYIEFICVVFLYTNATFKGTHKFQSNRFVDGSTDLSVSRTTKYVIHYPHCAFKNKCHDDNRVDAQRTERCICVSRGTRI
jgi:hypothetical protein